MKNLGFSRILLATDGSDESQAATVAAATLARESGAAVRVVHVWNLELHHRHGVWDVEMRSEAEGLIHETVHRLRAQGIEAAGAISRSDNDHIAAAVAEAATATPTTSPSNRTEATPLVAQLLTLPMARHRSDGAPAN